MFIPKNHEYIDDHRMESINEPYDLVKVNKKNTTDMHIFDKWVQYMQKKQARFLACETRTHRILFVQHTPYLGRGYVKRNDGQ